MRRRTTMQPAGSAMPGDGSPGPVEAARHEAPPSSAGDLDAYLAHLAHLDMPVAMKIDLIAALRTIMQSFVDRAFGDDPVQQVGRRTGRAEGDSSAEDARAAPPMLDSLPTTPTETDDNELTGAFRDHAGRGGRRK